MAKYALLNCWDDLNKGDLGIMIATVEEFHRQDAACRMIGISSFDRRDHAFSKAHNMLRQYVPEVYSGLFGVLGLNFLGRFRKDLVSKLLAFVMESVRYSLCQYTPSTISKIFLTSLERETLNAIMSCDVAFSKGGSVFTDYGNIRGTISLLRLCRMYNLLHKFGMPYYILGQSFGPVMDGRGVHAVNRVIENAAHVYIREMKCVRKYPKLHLMASNVSFSNDAGFLLEPKVVTPSPIDCSCLNVGITVRAETSDVNYIDVITQMITYLVSEKGAIVHIFRQVAMDNEPDNLMAERIINDLPELIKNKVIYHKENYLPQELCWLYGEMDYFIGTRLHSTIFSMRAGTPAIGIVYHGTKTQGIFDNIGVPELVISAGVTFEVLKEKFEYMVSHKEHLVAIIEKGVGRARTEMKAAIHEIITSARGENR